MQFNTWGIGRREELVRNFDADEYPFIERVRSHLCLTLVEIRGNGEPVQIALGEQADATDPEAVRARVTPFFSSFEALDFFCRMNLQQYLAFDPTNGLPRRWFWDDSNAQRGRTLPQSGVRTVGIQPSAETHFSRRDD
jgi:hypothetical protein